MHEIDMPTTAEARYLFDNDLFAYGNVERGLERHQKNPTYALIILKYQEEFLDAVSRQVPDIREGGNLIQLIKKSVSTMLGPIRASHSPAQDREEIMTEFRDYLDRIMSAFFEKIDERFSTPQEK